MTLPSIFGFNKLTGLIVANKLAVTGMVVVVAIAVPMTVYVANKPNTDQQISTEQVAPEVKGNDSTVAVPTGNTSNNQPTSNQQAENRTSPQLSTGNQTPNIGSNSTTNNQPSNTTPTPNNQTTTPPPATPTVDWWDIVVTSYSPTNCLIYSSTKCPRGTNVSATVKFVDRSTGDYITVTNCSSEGTISSGPQYLTANGGTRFTTQTTKIDSYTCSASFTPPDYGTYGIWLTATTTESPNHPQLSNNTKYWQIAP